jgi:hypothetical protein
MIITATWVVPPSSKGEKTRRPLRRNSQAGKEEVMRFPDGRPETDTEEHSFESIANGGSFCGLQSYNDSSCQPKDLEKTERGGVAPSPLRHQLTL